LTQLFHWEGLLHVWNESHLHARLQEVCDKMTAHAKKMHQAEFTHNGRLSNADCRVPLVIMTKRLVNALGIDRDFLEAGDSKCASKSHDETSAEYCGCCH
jgi:hypothetical protein